MWWEEDYACWWRTFILNTHSWSNWSLNKWFHYRLWWFDCNRRWHKGSHSKLWSRNHSIQWHSQQAYRLFHFWNYLPCFSDFKLPSHSDLGRNRIWCSLEYNPKPVTTHSWSKPWFMLLSISFWSIGPKLRIASISDDHRFNYWNSHRWSKSSMGRDRHTDLVNLCHHWQWRITLES